MRWSDLSLVVTLVRLCIITRHCVFAQPIRINAGGNSFSDSNGNNWVADTVDNYFTTGKSFSKRDIPVSGTKDQELYQTERFSDTSFAYNIPVSNGVYQVHLHFAELYEDAQGTGARIFDVKMEGSTFLENFDIFQEAGGAYKPLVKSDSVTVNDGVLSIEFVHKAVQNPKICGIEVLPIDAEPMENDAVEPKAEFEPIYINAGSDKAEEDGGIEWQSDKYFIGGETFSTDQFISGTTYDKIYKTERYGVSFQYEIPVPNGSYLTTLHFADIYDDTHATGKRLFDVFIEDSLVIDNLDIYDTVGGYVATTVDVPVNVNDGAISINFKSEVGHPKISAIEIKASEGTTTSSSGSGTETGTGTETETETGTGTGTPHTHYAHAVAGGPYVQVDTNQNGEESIEVNGQFSHTHRPNAKLKRWTWMVDGDVKGSGEATTIVLPVGQHELILEVEDDEGDVASEVTTVTVHEFGFPHVSEVVPNWGGVDGGEKLTITGSGFTVDTTVHLGSTKLSGSDITIVGSETIEVRSAPSGASGLVQLSVQTSLGKSNEVTYTYVNPELPSIQFKSGDVTKNIKGTTLAFGPDGRLYVGTSSGDIVRLTLSDDHKVIAEHTSSAVAKSEPVPRTILGLAFNPLDTSENPTVYVSHSWLFNQQDTSYNGKVSAVSGANLDTIKDVITGLPVSDHDHGINGIEFGDTGELYIQVAGTTNAGIPGPMSSREQREEDALSSATLVAWNINEPDFDGNINYDDQGNQISGFDVEVFAPGQRNSFDIVLHSNGKLYATDNGPNPEYGPASTSCNDKSGSNPKADDKLNHIVQGGYYGHANRKRGATDQRQCTWRSIEESGDGVYMEAIAKLPPSSDGICEFQTEHFGGQLRGQLIIGRYKGELRNVRLENNGEATASGKQEYPPVLLKDGGLDVTQGPDGTLFVADYDASKIIFHSPDEGASAGLKVKSVFPRRGPSSGGSSLTLYGDNLATFGFPDVTVGGKTCSVEYVASNSKITCKLPSGAGTADVVVTSGMQTDVFNGGYRYVNTAPLPAGHTPPPPPPLQPTPPPPPPPSPAIAPDMPAVTTSSDLGIGTFYFVNSDTGQDIGPVDTCKACYPSMYVNIRVDTFGDVHSVKLTLEGPIKHTNIENTAPYTLFMDQNGETMGQFLSSGSYTVSAQAFSASEASGVASEIKSVDFSISALRKRLI